MAANKGRVAAARALMLAEQGQHVEAVLAEHAPQGRDRGLGWFLALGVLRHRGQVDAALRPLLRQPLGGLDVEVRTALRLGAFEILFARTKRHAAVNEAVEVTRALGAKRATGLVNAVLRRVEAPHGMSRAEALDHPEWLVARWDARYGTDAVDGWCGANRENPPLFVVTAGDDTGVRTEWEAAGVKASAVADHVYRIDGPQGAVPDLPGFEDGLFWVQDASSVAVADLVDVQPGITVLDACAAPGGKSFRLASRGAAVHAVDLSPARLDLLAESAHRLGLEVATQPHDWTKGPVDLPAFDAVLVDAPCTALGLVRRHPEIRWRRQLVDVLQAPARQGAILAAASAHVRPGGQLVYAVCSPEPEEGRGVVDAFLAAHPDFRLDHTLSTAPPAHDEDAFFGARMVRA